jgi:2,3-bisphosphoglycerate-independent phosphoglycerate mutase
MDHLKALIRGAKKDGVKTVRVHILLDGRDVDKTSAHLYVEDFEKFLAEVNSDVGFDAKIASGGGRMYITMDRYGANWKMVERGWKTHVRGEGRKFASALEAIKTLREETEAIDQDLPAFVIADSEGNPVGPIVDHDSVVFFNFRGDRALEMTAAFEDDDFPYFDRGVRPNIEYAGMMQYDGDKGIPKRFLVSPPAIDRTLGEFLANESVRMYAISETQKYGHVTYFFNGNRLGKFNEQLETYQEITSDILPFEQRPWMKAAEITDAVIDAIESGQFDFIRLNFANGDMVGHTGVYAAAEIAVETVDLCIGRLMKAIRKAGGVMLISADHGNADDMYEHNKKTGEVALEEDGSPKAKTAHSLNPVPCHLYAPTDAELSGVQLESGLGISSLAATCMNLLGFEAPEDYDPSILQS